MFEFVFMNLYNIVSFHSFDSSSSDEDVPLAAVHKCVGKSNGDQTDNDDKGDDEDDKYDEEVLSTGKKSDENSGHASVSLIEGVHVVQNHNPQCDNLGSNFVGLTSHLALRYVLPLGPFSVYVGIFVQPLLYKIIYTNSYFLSSISYKQIGIILWFHTNKYVPIRIFSDTIPFK